jgi:hypothetical protein
MPRIDAFRLIIRLVLPSVLLGIAEAGPGLVLGGVAGDKPPFDRMIIRSASPAPLRTGSSEPATPLTRPRLWDFGRMPLYFEANEGQTDQAVQYLARGPGYTVFLTPTEAVLMLRGRPLITSKC